MRPVLTRLKGFGPHIEETVIDWEKAGPLVGIAGHNGAGKTFIQEADFAALFGFFPSRPGSIYGRLSHGESAGELESTFDVAGARYVARRVVKDTGKTQRTEATLAVVEAGGMERIIAGPKQDDFDRAASALVGTAETALATWFSAQGGVGDMSTVPPKERRAVFATLLRFDEKLAPIAAKANEAARREEARAQVLESQVATQSEEGLRARIEAADSAIAAADTDADAAEQERAEAELRLEALRNELRAAGGDDDLLKSRIAEHKTALRHENLLAADLARVLNEIADLQRIIAGRAEAEAAKALASELATRRDTLRQQQAAWSALNRWNSEKARLKNDLDAARLAVANLRAASSLPATDQALAAQLGDLRAQYDREKAANDVTEAANKKADADRRDAQRNVDSLTSRLAELREKSKRRPDTPFGAECAPCPLMREWADVPTRIKDLEASLAEAQAVLAAVPAAAPLADLSDLIARGKEAKAAAARVQAAAAAKAAIDEADGVVARAEQALETHHDHRPADVTDPAADLRDVQDRLEAATRGAVRLDRIAEAEAQLVAVSERKAAIDADLGAATASVALTEGPCRAAEAALQSRAAAVASLQQQISETERVRAAAQASVTAAATRRGAAQSAHAAAKEALAKWFDLEAEARTVRARASRLRLIETAFGPKGAQNLLIDHAAPELESIARDMLHRASKGHLSLRIATQRVTRDGKPAEDFQIRASDERGERDIAEFSGGERRFLTTVLRLSVLVWQARLSGRRAQSLRIDETFDALDAENADRMVDLLTALSGEFDRIMIITHDETLASRLPSRIVLTKRAAGVRAELN